ncbi:dTDP-4-dehydrorhamnose 3,5-epimerase family protein [Rhodococcus sp. NPDC057529]|uniref:dTDP-4-dehydrorhamnose 3,5-epimerase family protein n=1 Tax=Rhodococcus sp. NPDC057529 TaxID=3346158 RepID=UPI00366FFC5F
MTVEFRQLEVAGSWEITPTQFGDDRGVFVEWFKDPTFVGAVGQSLNLAQANCSVSASGVLRGIHFADVPPGQAKYVTCIRGSVLDVVVDIRVGSPTFGSWDSVLLDDVDRRAIYISEGLGHAFLSLEDGSAVVYLCSEGYSPGREHGINPLDPQLGIDSPTTSRSGEPLELILSEKDTAAPSLAEASASGLLPQYLDVREWINGLD